MRPAGSSLCGVSSSSWQGSRWGGARRSGPLGAVRVPARPGKRQPRGAAIAPTSRAARRSAELLLRFAATGGTRCLQRQGRLPCRHGSPARAAAPCLVRRPP